MAVLLSARSASYSRTGVGHAHWNPMRVLRELRQLRLTNEDWRLIMHFTRNWLHYGWMAMVLFCTLVGAVEGVMGS